MNDDDNDFPGWVDRKAIEAAARMLESPVDSLERRAGGIIDGTIRPIRTPWHHFDDIKAAMPGTLNVVCGDPGSAKSFLVLQLMAFAQHHGKDDGEGVPIALLELECSRDWHLHRYLAQLSGNANVTNIDWIAKHGDEMTALIQEHRQTLDRLGRDMTVTDGKLWNQHDIMEWAKTSLKRGVKLLAIDPITAMQPSQRPWEDDQYLITGLRRLVEEHHAAAWLVTHPKKGRRNEVSMEVLAGGAAISRFTDVVLWLERKESPETHIVEGNVVWTHSGSRAKEHRHERMVRVLRVLKCRDGTAAGRKLSVELDIKHLTITSNGWIIRIEKDDETDNEAKENGF